MSEQNEHRADQRRASASATLPRTLRTLAGAILGGALIVASSLAAAPSAQAACANEALRETQHSTALPDCRTYELVSPPGKNGGEMLLNSTRNRAAVGGSAIALTSRAGFGDVVGGGIAMEYAAQRSSSAAPGDNGWATHAITPAQPPTPLAFTASGYEPRYQFLSQDLTAGVFQSVGPVTEEPLVEEVSNLYSSDEILKGGERGYRLASACPLCAETETPLPPYSYSATPPGLSYPALPFFATATEDARHVVWDSMTRLTADSTADNAASSPRASLYLSSDGEVQQVGLVPESGTSCADPHCVAPGGQGAIAGQVAREPFYSGKNSYAPHVIAEDGSRLVFTADQGSCPDPSRYAACGGLFLRDVGANPETTVKLNVPERTTPGSPETGVAAYWSADAADSRVFFSTEDQLTDEDENATVDLYMWRAQADGEGHHLQLISIQDPSQPTPPPVTGVVGASEDGSSVYFTARGGQLVAGEPDPPAFAEALYLWHDGAGTPPGGEVRYIGNITTSDWRADHFGAEARVSPDGTHLLFAASYGGGLLSRYGGNDYDQGSCPLAGAPVTGCSEFYYYDASAETLQCASCRPDGEPPTVPAVSEGIENSIVGDTPYLNRTLSADGRYVFFSTKDPLVPRDTNGSWDAYEYDTQTEAIDLLSSGTAEAGSYFVDASADGKDAFVATRQPLVGWDIDRAYDIYDVRVDGGFPEPRAEAAPCNGEGSCRDRASATPGAPSPASSSLVGSGDVVQTRPHCHKPRRLVRRHGKLRCLKPRHRMRHHGAHHHRKQGHNRGGGHA